MIIEPDLFRDAEDAWFWYCAVQVEKWRGMRSCGTGRNRPCDIDDIGKIFGDLCRDAKISEYQAYVLSWYGGVKRRPPDKRYEPRELVAWIQGLDVLHTPLARKGIIDLTSAQKACRG